MYVIIVVSFRVVMMSWFHSRENYFRFLQWIVTTTRSLSNGTIEPASSLISISMVWNRRCNRGQYCIESSTRVIISPSLPSAGTIPNNGTWASPTILGSTKGQYTYREFNPFLTSATQSKTYSPVGNIAFWILTWIVIKDWWWLDNLFSLSYWFYDWFRWNPCRMYSWVPSCTFSPQRL